MKIVKEHINEIKIGKFDSELGSIGVGHSGVMAKAYKDLRQLANDNALEFNEPIISGNDRIFNKAAEIFGCAVTDLYMMHFYEHTQILSKLRERFGKETDTFSYNNERNSSYDLRFTFQIWKDPDIIYSTHTTRPGQFDVNVFVNKKKTKLLESNSILEIKRGANENPLSSIGVGSMHLYSKLKKFIDDNFVYSHDQWLDKKAERIASVLNLEIDNLRKISVVDEVVTDPEEYVKKIEEYMGEPYTRHFVSYNKKYWLWNSVPFILEYDNSKNSGDLFIYTNRHIYKTFIDPEILYT